jgi:starch synthase (maltosyl-transferring)
MPPALGEASEDDGDGAPAREPRVARVLDRMVIQDVRPRAPGADHYAKAVVGEAVRVTVSMFRDGHDPIAGRALLYADPVERAVPAVPTCEPESGFRGDEHVAATPGPSGELHDTCELTALGNDEWEAILVPRRVGPYRIVIEGWSEHDPLSIRAVGDEGPDRTTSRPSLLWADRERALFSAWYELFPRSFGGFKGTAARVPDVAAMGFDVLYLPPIHPIGITARKGPNNTLVAGPDDPGSPWAIGSSEGGHTAIHPELGTVDDFSRLLEEVRANGMEVALDYALQCSPDHPWVKDHPQWFHHRSDGTIACAENPPKIYQDIYPLNFWPPDEKERVAMWEACKSILDYWIGLGVRNFRVDNPHTKPIAFWEWVIEAVHASHPEVLFLAEAFTRPKVMARLAEAGFSQSYTYFTWRTEQHGPDGLWAYLDELAHGPVADYMRPNFWPNTPDILSGPLRNGPPAAFALRLVLASTMSPSYGVYSGYELYENVPASPANEEYLNSEKYEIKHRDYDRPDGLAPLMTSLNRVRRRHPAFQRLRSIRFHPSSNPQIVAYSKMSDDRSDVVLVVVNLDPYWTQSAVLSLDLDALGLPANRPYLIYDELSGEAFEWIGANPFVRLQPPGRIAHIFDMRSGEGSAGQR